MLFRLIVYRSAITVAVIGAAVLGAPGAHADGLPLVHGTKAAPGVAQAKKPFVVEYTKRWKWVSHPLRVCIKFTATGHFTYRNSLAPGHPFLTERWKDQVIHDPTLKVASYKMNCRTRLSIGRFDITQHWTGYSCSFNPHISISATVTGLSLAVSAWPSCGNRTQALFGTSYAGGEHHTQFNSGSPIGFGEYDALINGVEKPPPPCYGIFPSAIIHAHGNSDSFGAGNLMKSQKVCLPGHTA